MARNILSEVKLILISLLFLFRVHASGFCLRILVCIRLAPSDVCAVTINMVSEHVIFKKALGGQHGGA